MGRISDDEEEQITVTRQEDERDPEADAEFDRELAKLMAESVESRKFERKPAFDVPLPMRRARETTVNPEDGVEHAPVQAPPVDTMKFSLLSRRGNKQQTRSIDLPSDSTFAVSMRSKQQAEKEEQQRIKNLVLNYDLRDDNEIEGESPFLYNIQRNYNRTPTKYIEGIEKTHNPYAQPRLDKGGNNRSHQRARKLQLSDVNWYDTPSPSSRQSRVLQSSASGGTSLVDSPIFDQRDFPSLSSPSIRSRSSQLKHTIRSDTKEVVVALQSQQANTKPALGRLIYRT